MGSRSKFYDIPGTHTPHNHNDSTPLLRRRRDSSYFRRSSKGGLEQQTQQQSLDDDKDEINSDKLGTFNGVFVPTALNVLSILMFLRFGFILGQMGILGSFLLLIMSYFIDLMTTLSISAISTNGTVRGGGAYYMVSRSLGPEFGGSIGLVFYIGQVLNSGLNVVGFIEPLLANLGQENGLMFQLLPEGYWWEFLYSTSLLFICICVALVGSQLVSKAGFLLFFLLLTATISIPISALFVKPFYVPEFDLFYSGLSWNTFKENLYPHFTKGAAGSLLKGKETFNDLFGIFFPATAGIFAGASMSGDLRKPSKSIPKGTLWGLLLTFICYGLVILSLGAAVPRELLHRDIQIIQTVNLSSALVLLGEFSTSLFSVIVGIVGAANVLQAIAKDAIFPGLNIFSKVDKNSNNPINAILFTWLLCQLCLFANVNQIATYITMAFLMTFIVTNLACFLLKIASAPNFRPSFRFFDWHTAFVGGIACAIAMFIVDGISATIVVIFLIGLFLFIHYICPPKPWGDVSQSLIYHQVRKYLLRLRQDNVKYWRPQILLLVDSPRSSWNLIHFCNHLKKGGLYILGHVIVSESFQTNFSEFKEQQNAWIKLRDLSKIKAFVQIGLGPTLPWGVRNVFLGSGLGGMKPNITVLGFFDMLKHYPKTDKHLKSQQGKPHTGHNVVNIESLPTDKCRNEKRVSIQNWVQILEDLILMQANVAVAKGFENMEMPTGKQHRLSYYNRDFIDLYPIQMTAEVFDKNGEKSASTTNFDTYTLILQLGAILTTVPNWKKTHRLRIVVFVEDRADTDNERQRVQSLIEVLRIRAEILVVCLADFKVYNTIVKGGDANLSQIDSVLDNEDWWNELKGARENERQTRFNIPSISIAAPYITDNHGLQNKKYKLSKLQKMGLSFSMTTNRLFNEDIHRAAADTDSEDDSDYESYTSESEFGNNSSNFDQLRRVRTEQPYKTPSASNSTTSLGSHLNVPKKGQTDQARHIDRMPSSSSTLNLALQSAKKNKRPNFSSEKVPRSKVIDDATGDEPSIVVLPDQKQKKGKHIPYIPKASYNSGSNQEPTYGSTNLKEPVSPTTYPNAIEDENEEEEEGLDINNLSFNDLPAKAQHLILNDLMKTISKNVPVIFSTLPAPVIGTHYSEEDCKEYLENLQVWCDDLPPIFLINSQSMTVTTAL
ncbi:putative transporter [Wickerhamomyces ciferrii]|uniref:Transporter n=1 Tax=Wickerhamomyces ciferrii (strain ATCC 14091 / BCRC 22168 / CBS 111 / JCM 3599 / NBRC 0793 / NRRL Y-1031 F-60-10) TaxID=1206466 RepID=K0KE91_WICCF|nr:putative transporter [Wickerhamomyces ciferrii]CCH40562.1 putative transporter [Wickerhamomyces ciferrii]